MHKTNATTKPARRSPRLSADERRDAVVAAGMDEFAAHGLAGASVDAIAKRAGVSQPYVYQLFGTKKDLFLAVVRRGFERTRLAFEEALRRQRAGEFPACDLPLGAMGIAYMELLDDRTLLLVQPSNSPASPFAGASSCWEVPAERSTATPLFSGNNLATAK
jgi:AcrR family transcriptional regulator